jgi:HK97 family phage prohead protease
MTGTRAPEIVLYEATLEPTRAGDLYTGLSGLAVPYGVWTNRGWFLESVAPGAFDKSIQEAAAGLPLLMFHDDGSLPVGISDAWDSRKDGLYGHWRLDTRPEAQEAGRLADEGMLRWFSVGHQPIRSEWTRVAADAWDPDLGPDHMDRLTRLEARLLETSLLTTPAFGTAQVDAVDRMLADAQVRYGRTAERPREGVDYRPRVAAWRRWAADHR